MYLFAGSCITSNLNLSFLTAEHRNGQQNADKSGFKKKNSQTNLSQVITTLTKTFFLSESLDYGSDI